MATLPMPRILMRSEAWNDGAAMENPTRKPNKIMPAPTNLAKTTPRLRRCLLVARIISRSPEDWRHRKDRIPSLPGPAEAVGRGRHRPCYRASSKGARYVDSQV